MKVLYGIQATGNGHISRCRIMAKYLKQQNIDVTYLVSGRAKEDLFDMEVFGDFQHRQGLTFVTNRGKVNYAATAVNNNLARFIRDIYALDLEPYDVIITDFEPVTAWAGKLRNKTVIGIGHQYAFGDKTPVAGANPIAKMVMKYFAPASISAGLHWYPFDDTIFPPIIDTTLLPGEQDGSILVYLPFEDQQDVTRLLSQFSGQEFILYSPELEDKTLANVKQRKTCYAGFKHDLTKARGVICNSGFELISECLHLGLPILTKPIQGQMEQLSNAMSLEKLGYARVMHTLDGDTIEHWLTRLKPCQPRHLPDVAKALASWIASGDWQPPTSLVEQIWPATD
ncbi:MJ1255/VC2487 family glycosyltransferase [Thalassomonas sp. RHCl1]|uniref:MJ1255/VC2487 family glycosyltransferase n=1 Tax=Thalassomonas sp. RHCl1 TaxID=2995320 RepID=UPI00248B741C|nr:MJ1255/VC2487 family glycosyltransferase [Thalassomonas sp. RHCl1]